MISTIGLIVCLFAGQSVAQMMCPKREAPFGRFMFPCHNRQGMSCTYNCYSDSYPPRLITSSTVTCTASGAWTGSLECTGAAGPTEAEPQSTEETREIRPMMTRRVTPAPDVCPDVNPPDNGYVENSCSRARDGETCVFGCLEGRVLRGVPSIRCRSGRWDSEPPVCEKRDCPERAAPANGTLRGVCKTAQVGQVCIYSCNSGFAPVSPDTRMMCTTKGWTGDEPRCSQVTCKPILSSMIDNALLEGDCNPGVGLAFCSIWCKKGFALIGKSLMYCTMDGEWTPADLPSCTQLPDSVMVTMSPPPRSTSVSGQTNITSVTTIAEPVATMTLNLTTPPTFDASIAPSITSMNATTMANNSFTDSAISATDFLTTVSTTTFKPGNSSKGTTKPSSVTKISQNISQIVAITINNLPPNNPTDVFSTVKDGRGTTGVVSKTTTSSSVDVVTDSLTNWSTSSADARVWTSNLPANESLFTRNTV